MPDYTVSGDVDSMLRSANDAAIRSAIGVGQTDAPTFLGLALTGTTNQLLKMNASNWFGTDTSQVYLYNSGLASPVVSLNNGSNIAMRYDWGLAWTAGASTGSLDLILARDAPGILAQRNGTNAQAFRVYNTTDAGLTNFERVNLEWSGGLAILQTVKGGTGADRSLVLRSASELFFGVAGGSQWKVDGNAHFLAVADNQRDIGASGANRPRNVYVGTNLIVAGGAFTGSEVNFNGFNFLTSRGDGIMSFIGVGGTTGFNRIQLGGTTSAFPAIKRNGTGIDIVLANDSGFAPLAASAISYTTSVLSASGSSGAFGTTGTEKTYINQNSLRIFGFDSGLFLLGAAFTNANPAIKRNGTELQAKLADDSAFTFIQGKLKTETAYTATVVAATGYITIYDSTGTAYRVPCAV